MDCNRDEAIRAKNVANEKLGKRDFAAARQFVLKAQSLYPELEGLSQMLTTIDIYMSAANKLDEEVDWYGVFGINPTDDYETLNKQYRKLALLLHPNINRSAGAHDAFRLLCNGWSLLSDKSKRLAYDQKRLSSTGFQQNFPMHESSSSAPQQTNGCHNYDSRTSAAPKTHHSASQTRPASVPAPSQLRCDTFWTICNQCKMHYEYMMVYLNQTLLCPNCHQAFLASEMPPPFNYSNSSSSTSHNQHQNLNDPAPANNSSHSGRNAFSAAEGSRSRDGDGFASASVSRKSGFNPGFSVMFNKPRSTRDMTPVQARNILMDKARNVICEKLNEWRSQTSTKRKYMDTSKDRKPKKARRNGVNGQGHHVNGTVDLSGTLMADQAEKCSKVVNAGDLEISMVPSMDVPDPEFHDFDLERNESSFGENQVWAAYDNDDGMPRFYALINKVISRKPFKVRISWLNSKTNSEFGTMDWVSSGFHKSCGVFRLGKHEMNKSINSFSHKVQWSKGPRGVVHIFPKKGEIWAVYRYWSPDWNEHTPDEVVHKYDMIIVLDDYNEEGVSVAPLIKVAGFKTLFLPHPEPQKVVRIPKEEMFRFSHQVPYYILTREEAPNAPNGCLELDPASTPLELLQVLTETGDGVSKEGTLPSSPVITEGKIEGNGDIVMGGDDGENRSS